MTQYRATISAGRWPYEVTVEASNWATAAARSIKQWRKRFKGDKADELKIRIVCVKAKTPVVTEV